MKDTDEKYPKNPGTWQPRCGPRPAPEPAPDKVRREIKTLLETNEKQEEAIERLADLIARSEYEGKRALWREGKRSPLLPAMVPSAADELGRKLAKLGVTVDVVPEGDDRARVTIGSPEIREAWTLCLSLALADTLEALCEDSGPADGDLVMWKSMSDLARGLLKRTGRALSPRAITVRVSRLRRALEDAGVSRLLVQRSREGYRFARKARGSPEILGR